MGKGRMDRGCTGVNEAEKRNWLYFKECKFSKSVPDSKMGSNIEFLGQQNYALLCYYGSGYMSLYICQNSKNI